MRVGLTGGIASGKSTVLAKFKALGASTIDADVEAREVVKPGTEGLQKVIDRFGSAYINKDGTLNRKKLGQLIFADEANRIALNNILHPLINANIRRKMAEFETLKPNVPVIVDIPLLVENNLMALFDQIIVVHIPFNLQLERLMARNGLSESEAKRRIQAQLPLDKKTEVADYVIDNSGDENNTERQVERIWLSLCRKMGQGGLSSDGGGA